MHWYVWLTIALEVIGVFCFGMCAGLEIARKQERDRAARVQEARWRRDLNTDWVAR